MPYKGIETTDFACQSVEMTGDFFVRAVYDPILNLVHLLQPSAILVRKIGGMLVVCSYTKTAS